MEQAGALNLPVGVTSVGEGEEDFKKDISHTEDVIKMPNSPTSLKAVSRYADMPRKQALRVFWKVALCCLGVAWTAIMDGYLISIPGSIVANKSFIAQFGTERNAKGALVLDPRYVGGFTAVQSIGQIIGMLSGGWVSDRFGRKANLFSLSVILALGVVLEIVAKNDPVWLCARLFAGWGTGLTQTTVPVYISEIAPTQLRGALLVTYNFWNGVGQFAAAIALQISATHYYKQVIYTQFLFIGVMVIVFLLVPESPWYYLHKEDTERAKKSLQTLNGHIPGYDIDYEFEVMCADWREAQEQSRQQKSQSFLECLRGTNRRRTFIAWLPLQFQGLGGLSFVLSYTTYFFQLAGYPKPFQANAIVKTMQLTAQIISFYTIERVGRRRLLVGCGTVMTAVCLVLGVLGCFPISDTPGGVLVFLFCLWTFSYASSCGPIGWAYTVEVSTPRLRAKTAGLAAAGTACIGVFTNFVSPIMIAHWILKTGFFFFGTALIGVIAMYFCVPEVSGRNFAELDELFDRKISARHFPETVCICTERNGQAAVLGSKDEKDA